jgi:beta-lactam-binding protein with PASTA domain
MDAAKAVTATFNLNPLLPPPPPPPNCVVPKLKGESLGKAKSALRNANCKTGKVTKPKPKKGKKQGPLVVKSSSPGAGTALPADSKVDLRLKHTPSRNRRSGSR